MRRAHLQINDISVSCGTFKATDRTKTGINNKTGNPAGNHYTHTYRTRTPPTGLWHCEERGCGWSVHMVRVWHLLPLRVPINHTRQITFRQQRVVLACDVRSICVDTSGLGRQRAQRTVSERGGDLDWKMGSSEGREGVGRCHRRRFPTVAVEKVSSLIRCSREEDPDHPDERWMEDV